MHSFYDLSKKKYLSFLRSHDDLEEILSALRSHEEKQLNLRFGYKFTDFELNIPIDKNCLDKSSVPVNYYVNYKMISKQIGDIFKFKKFGTDVYLLCIKKKLIGLFSLKYVILEDFESVFDANFVNQPQKFQLYYFDSLSSCLESFKVFVSFLNILKCSKEDSNIIDSDKNVFKISYLEQYLREKINSEFKNKLNGDTRTQQIYEQIDLLYKRCFDEINKRLSTNNFILPIRGSYTKEFYFDQFYRIIKKIIEEMIEDIEESYKDFVPYFNHIFFERFNSYFYKMYLTFFDLPWISLNIIGYFSNLIGKEIKSVEDFREVDKILCDFKNMMCFANGLKIDQIRENKNGMKSLYSLIILSPNSRRRRSIIRKPSSIWRN